MAKIAFLLDIYYFYGTANKPGFLRHIHQV